MRNIVTYFILFYICSGYNVQGPPGSEEPSGRREQAGPQQLDKFGRPGESRPQGRREYTEQGREAVFNRYTFAKHIPFYWSRSKKLKHIASELGIPEPLELTNGFITKLDDQMKYLPSLSGDVPAPPSYRSTNEPSSMNTRRPDWLPADAIEFGRDRGPPGTTGPDAINVEKLYRRGAGPPSGNPQSRKELPNKEKAKNFMKQFGYVDEVQSKSNRMSDREFTKNVRDIQHQYGLRETGQLDDELLKVIATPRCGKEDTPRSKSGQNVRAPSGYKINEGRHKWGHSPVSYSLVGYSSDLPPEIQVDAFKRAFAVWSEKANIDFKDVGYGVAESDINIYSGYLSHGDAWPFDGPNSLLAHAFYPDAIYQNLMGDMHFDEAEFWTLGEGKVVRAIDPNDQSGAPKYCHFPFWYDGVEYKSCIESDDNPDLEWCATTSDYTRDGKMGYCGSPKLYTIGGNSNGEKCHFPFTVRRH